MTTEVMGEDSLRCLFALAMRNVGWEVRVVFARTFFQRLLGMTRFGRRLSDACNGSAMAFVGCGCVHTFWMDRPLDIVFIDRSGSPLALHEFVPSRRIVHCPGAFAVIERLSGDAHK